MTLAGALLLATLQAPGAFPVFVWRGPDAAENPEAAGRLAAFGGAPVLGADEAAWLREQELGFFVFNAPGRDALHLERGDPAYQRRWSRWFETRDDELLVRTPCLTDPAVRAELLQRLGASLSARGGDAGLGVSLGDEVSLTPAGSPEDVCLSETCRAAWRTFLKSRPGLDDAERERLTDPARLSTDATRLELTDGRTELLGGWLLRRRFHQQVLLDLLAELAEATRRRSPGTPVGLLGMGGQTAFGNVAVERALPWLDFAECYPTADARELLLTLRDPELKAWATVFPAPRNPNRAARSTFEHWLRGGDGLVIWSERALTESPELAARTARAVADVRRLRAALPGFRPRPARAAVVHSADSLAVSWLRDALLDGPTWPRRLAGHQEENGTLERSLDAWLRYFEDLGLLPGALPLEEVGAPTVRRFDLLVLNRVLVLSDDELEHLRAYLEAGGTLVVHGELGWVDEMGRVREGSALEELREDSARVLTAPQGIDEYPLFRTARDGERRRALAARIAARLRSGGWEPPAPPWTIRGLQAQEVPWLSAWEAQPEGAWLCATLPAGGGRIRAMEVLIEPGEGFEVVWIHPAGDGGKGTLPAGDAAVFRVVRE